MSLDDSGGKASSSGGTDEKAEANAEDAKVEAEDAKPDAAKVEATKAEAEPAKVEAKPAKAAPDAKVGGHAKSAKGGAVSKGGAKTSGKPIDGDGVVKEPADIPPTRRQEALAEPPARPSASSLEMHAPLAFPDDGPFSARLRKIDTWIGRGEQVVLMTLFAFIVVVAAAHALADRLFHVQIHFKDEVIRGGTFALAMLAGAFATHQARHLSMDLISRRLSPRNRLFLKVFLALFTVGIVLLLIRAGLHTITTEQEIAAGRSDSDSKLITPVRIAYTIPLGGGLIILHTLLHALIDIDYIRRRKVPPERMRSGH